MRQIFIRDVNSREINGLYKGLKSSSAFTLRRCQILISSVEGKNVKEISKALLCTDQCVRNAIRNFNKYGLKSIVKKQNNRNNNSKAFDEAALKSLEKIIAHSPTHYGIESETWNLRTLADFCYKRNIIKKQISSRTVGMVFKKAGLNWKLIKKSIIKKG